jgi:hypothetical protein
MHAKIRSGLTIAAVALIAGTLAANAAGAQRSANRHAGVGHLPRALENAYGYAPRQSLRSEAPPYEGRRDAFSSDSLGRQSFPNPDRDFSVENLRSHPW